MFCPICKSEYRPSFKRCADCDVPLVYSLPNAASPSPPQAPPELLWSGPDPAMAALLASALGAADIPYHRTMRDFDMIPGLPPVHAIFIPAREAEAARRVLDQARSESETGRIPESDDPDDLATAGHASPENPSAHSPQNSDSDSAADYVPDDFDPESATAEIWSGADAETKDMLVASLRENGIGSSLRRASGVFRLAVTPKEESRARQIVHEVAGASPPQ